MFFNRGKFLSVMPAIAHILFALLLSIFLIKFTEGKFKPKHALIFAVNNYFGPDMFGWLPWYGEGSNLYYFIHGYGWVIVALLVAIPWFIVNRFQLTLEKGKPIAINLRDKNDTDVIPYLQVYCLIAAGGLFHQFLDIIGHPAMIYYTPAGGWIHWGGVWFGGNAWLDINSILGTGLFPCGNTFEFTSSSIFFGIMIPIVALTAIFFIPRNNGKNFIKLTLILLVIYIIPLAISYYIPDPNNFYLNNMPDANYYGYVTNGNYPSTFYLTGGEADLGVLIFFVLLFFIPLTFLYWGYKGLPFQKKNQ